MILVTQLTKHVDAVVAPAMGDSLGVSKHEILATPREQDYL